MPMIHIDLDEIRDRDILEEAENRGLVFTRKDIEEQKRADKQRTERQLLWLERLYAELKRGDVAEAAFLVELEIKALQPSPKLKFREAA